jgi:hypothetical protein
VLVVVFAILLMIFPLPVFVKTMTFVAPLPELSPVDTVPTTLIVLGLLVPGGETLTALVDSPIVLGLTAVVSPIVRGLATGPFDKVFKSPFTVAFTELTDDVCRVEFLELGDCIKLAFEFCTVGLFMFAL